MAVVQINGHKCCDIKLDTRDEDEIQKVVLSDEKVKSMMNGREPTKIVIVKDKLVNILTTKHWSNKNYFHIKGR